MKRVRVEGDLYHGRVPEGAVYVGRAAPGLPASPYANPFKLKIHGRDAALDLYARYLDEHPELVRAACVETAGKDLACWCRLSEPCHADVLIRKMRECLAPFGLERLPTLEELEATSIPLNDIEDAVS